VADTHPLRADDGGRDAAAALQHLLGEIQALRDEQRRTGAAVEQALADTARRAEALARQSSEGLRAEFAEALARISAEVAEVHRTSGTLESGVGETKAALVELVEYDRQRRRREEEERARAEGEARAKRAAELNRAGKAHHRAGRRDESIAALTEARVLDPENAEILSNLGAALLAAGREGPAEEPLRRAVRARAEFASSRVNLGHLLLLRGEAEEAARHLEEAVRLDPSSSCGWNSLGNARWRLGAYGAAIEAWRRAWAADPFRDEARRNLHRQQELEG
jgi:tetratricopeptide (TPR) repeat protein